jgi:hypothetical protein
MVLPAGRSRSGAAQVARQHRLVADILGNHRLPKPLVPTRISYGLGKEVQRQRPFGVAFDLVGQTS